MSPELTQNLIDIGYLIAAGSFIMALKMMNTPSKARHGNWVAIAGMAIALAVTFLSPGMTNWGWIAGTVVVGSIVAAFSAKKIEMTAVPQMVALLNGLGGGAVALIALFEFLETSQAGIHPDMVQSVTTVLSAIIGSISFSGSLIAFGKLQEILPGRPLAFKGQQVFNLVLVICMLGLALAILAFQHTTVVCSCPWSPQRLCSASPALLPSAARTCRW